MANAHVARDGWSPSDAQVKAAVQAFDVAEGSMHVGWMTRWMLTFREVLVAAHDVGGDSADDELRQVGWFCAGTHTRQGHDELVGVSFRTDDPCSFGVPAYVKVDPGSEQPAS